MPTGSVVLRRCRLAGGAVVDLSLAGGLITAVGPELPAPPAATVLDAGGGAVLPGLHDHHVHLRALAAAASSVEVGPPAVADPGTLAATLAGADARLSPGAWLRAVGYHESVAGALDRHALDRLVPERPARVQHRSGILWVLNSAALAAIAAGPDAPPGVERDDQGRPTGRLWREDTWLRSRLPPAGLDLAAVSRAAAAAGVTAFTDATPQPDPQALASLAERAAAGVITQRLHLMSAPGVAAGPLPARVTLGPVKILLDDDRLPALDDLAGSMRAAHATGRPVAVHCVTRVQGVLAVAAFDHAGSVAGDRLEHAAVVGPDLVARIADLGLTVVTQPGFVRTRGDRYLADVDPADQPDLWRLGSLLAAGVAVAGGTDAPYGPADPWLAISAATDRRTAGGRAVGPGESVPAAAAVALFTGTAAHPAVARSLEPGQPADLCVLSASVAGGTPVVRFTVVAGRVVHPAA